jgi:diaminopimelate epimerase
VIVTVAGPVATKIFRKDGRVNAVRLEMGKAAIDRSRKTLDIGGAALDVTIVSVGNPHCVVFGEPMTRVRLFELGPRIENHAAFPNRINVQLPSLSRAIGRAP